jgi:hypothetical protein
VYVAERRLGVALLINLAGLAAFAAVALVAGERLGVAGIAAAYVLLHWALALAYAIDLARGHGVAIPRGLAREVAVAAAAGAAALIPFVLVVRGVALPAVAIAVAGVGAIAGIAVALVTVYRGLPLRRLLR